MKSYHEPSIERLLKTLRREKTDRIPNLEIMFDKRNIEAILGYPVAAASSLEMEPRDHVRLAQIIGMDAIGFGLYWDDFGRIYETAADGSRHYVDGRIKTWEDLAGIEPPPLTPWIEKLERYLAAAEGTNIGVWVYIHGPFDTAYLAMGYQDFFRAVYQDPALVSHIMDLATDFSIRAAEAVCRYPISFLWATDDVAQKDRMMLQADMFRELWLGRMARILEPAQRKGLPIVFHSDGYVHDFIPILLELGGIDAIHPLEPDGGNDIYALKRQFGDRISLIGNIDLSGPLSQGTPAMVEAEVREHIDRLNDGGGYIVSTSHSVVDSVIPKNYRAMIQTVHEYGKN